MTCRPLRQEPSLSSMKEKALASRRVGTQPWRRMASIGRAALRASLTRMRGMGKFCRQIGHKKHKKRKGRNASLCGGPFDRRFCASTGLSSGGEGAYVRDMSTAEVSVRPAVINHVVKALFFQGLVFSLALPAPQFAFLDEPRQDRGAQLGPLP